MGVLHLPCSVQLMGAKGKGRKGEGHTFTRRPAFPICAQSWGGVSPAWKGERVRQRGCAQVGATQQEGEGACNLPLHAPLPPSVPPLFACHVAHKGGGWAQGGEVGVLGRGCHVGDVAAHPCTLFTNWGGGDVPHADLLLCPVRANERPPFVLERGHQRGSGVFHAPCPVQVIGGSGQREGGLPFARRPASLFVCRGEVVRSLCMEVGGTSRAPEAGVQRRGLCRIGGGGGGVCLHPKPFCTPPCVCFPAKGAGRCQQVKARGGGVTQDVLLFTCCFGLFLFVLNF
jgi:hypothetical protein